MRQHQWEDDAEGYAVTFPTGGSSAAVWGEHRGERERGRERERERGGGSRGRTLSLTLSSIMAPIGLKAVVGESKIIIFLISLNAVRCSSAARIYGCICLRARACVCACECVFFFYRMRMSASAAGRWGWGRWWRWCCRCAIVPCCKAEPCGEGAVGKLHRLLRLSGLLRCGCAVLYITRRRRYSGFTKRWLAPWWNT